MLIDSTFQTGKHRLTEIKSFVQSYTEGPEKAMAPHSSTLAWKIPWMEEPGRLQSMGSRRVRQDWGISLSLFTFMHWRRKWQPTPVFLPGESQDSGAWWAAVYGVSQSRTWLKRLSSSSNIYLSLTMLKHFPCINLFFFHNNSVRKLVSFSLLYMQWLRLKRVSNLHR